MTDNVFVKRLNHLLSLRYTFLEPIIPSLTPMEKLSFFADDQRDEILEYINETAQVDSLISGGEFFGSYSTNTVDEWSDIDLTFEMKSDHLGPSEQR